MWWSPNLTTRDEHVPFIEWASLPLRVDNTSSSCCPPISDVLSYSWQTYRVKFGQKKQLWINKLGADSGQEEVLDAYHVILRNTLDLVITWSGPCFGGVQIMTWSKKPGFANFLPLSQSDIELLLYLHCSKLSSSLPALMRPSLSHAFDLFQEQSYCLRAEGLHHSFTILVCCAFLSSHPVKTPLKTNLKVEMPQRWQETPSNTCRAKLSNPGDILKCFVLVEFDGVCSSELRSHQVFNVCSRYAAISSIESFSSLRCFHVSNLSQTRSSVIKKVKQLQTKTFLGHISRKE